MKFIKIAAGFAALFFLVSAVSYAASRPYVRVLAVSGKAEFLAEGKSDWKKLFQGELLYSGDSIRTYADSSVELAFDEADRNIVSVRAGTQVVIALKGIEKIELIDGEVYALVKNLPAGSTFQIRTPTAVCGARGTGWGAKADKNETVVSAYENESYAKGLNKDGSVMDDGLIVPEGFETIVKRFMKPLKLTRISLEKVGLWNEWKRNILDFLEGKITRERLARNLEKIQKQKEKIERMRDQERMNKRFEKDGAGTGTGGSGSSGNRYKEVG